MEEIQITPIEVGSEATTSQQKNSNELEPEFEKNWEQPEIGKRKSTDWNFSRDKLEEKIDDKSTTLLLRENSKEKFAKVQERSSPRAFTLRVAKEKGWTMAKKIPKPIPNENNKFKDLLVEAKNNKLLYTISAPLPLYTVHSIHSTHTTYFAVATLSEPRDVSKPRPNLPELAEESTREREEKQTGEHGEKSDRQYRAEQEVVKKIHKLEAVRYWIEKVNPLLIVAYWLKNQFSYFQKIYGVWSKAKENRQVENLPGSFARGVSSFFGTKASPKCLHLIIDLKRLNGQFATEIILVQRMATPCIDKQEGSLLSGVSNRRKLVPILGATIQVHRILKKLEIEIFDCAYLAVKDLFQKAKTLAREAVSEKYWALYKKFCKKFESDVLQVVINNLQFKKKKILKIRPIAGFSTKILYKSTMPLANGLIYIRDVALVVFENSASNKPGSAIVSIKTEKESLSSSD
ncbi:26303_t:CDS:10 [Gigaspora rosea]|nr:26303_t:CDS:10 [Gigaspora rosea]